MMRRWMAAVLALIMVLGLAACSREAAAPDAPDSSAEGPADTGGQTGGTSGDTSGETPDDGTSDSGGTSDGGETAPDDSGETATTPDTGTSAHVVLSVTAHDAERTDAAGNLLLQENLREAAVTMPGSAAASINEALAGRYQRRVEEAADLLTTTQELQAEAASTGLPFSGYALTDRVEAGRLDNAVVSVVFTSIDATGGAHGNMAVEAMTFDAVTGTQLTLDNLTGDRNALRLAVAAAAEAQVAANPELYYPNAADQAGSLLEECTWALTDEGLTVYCDPYYLAPYAAGVVRVTVGYEDLEGLLNPRWFPEAAAADGTMTARLDESGAAAGQAAAHTVADEGGSVLVATADGAVHGVCIRRVSSSDGNTWYAGELLLAVDGLADGESVAVTAMLPDAMTNLMVTWEIADGTVCQGFFQSGKDGSVFLQPLETVVF